MRPRLVLVICVVAVVALASSAMAGSGRRCSFAGTWYGGSAMAKYLMRIVPAGGNSYSVTFEGAYTLAALGVAEKTTFSGDMWKIGPGLYEARVISLLTTQQAPPPSDPSSLGIDAARGFLELTECNEITGTMDYYVGYHGWGAEPFVDPPDVDYLGGWTIVETYRRISTAPMD